MSGGLASTIVRVLVAPADLLTEIVQHGTHLPLTTWAYALCVTAANHFDSAAYSFPVTAPAVSPPQSQYATPRFFVTSLAAATTRCLILFSAHSGAQVPNRRLGGGSPGRLDMSEKMMSRRGAFALLGRRLGLCRADHRADDVRRGSGTGSCSSSRRSGTGRSSNVRYDTASSAARRSPDAT